MGPRAGDYREGLARCHGFTAVAGDGPFGEVETLLFPLDSAEPDYLVVRASDGARQVRRPVVPAALIDAVNRGQRVVRFRGSAAELTDLPQSLPVARGTTGRALRRSPNQ